MRWSGRRDSNPRHSAWEADALPLSYSRLRCGGVSVAQVWLRNAYAIVAYPKANNTPLCAFRAFALEIDLARRNRRALVPRGSAAGQRGRRFGVAYHEAERPKQRADAGYAEHVGDADGRGERTDYE